jgi:hypothetical protein
MGVRKKAMPLPAAEDQLLRHLYLEFGFPSDQYARRPAERRWFVERWNDLAERSDEIGMDALHHHQEKAERVTFDGTHNDSPMPSDFCASEWAALRVAYTNVLTSRNLGSTTSDWMLIWRRSWRRNFIR